MQTPITSNLVVITGGPGSGKSTLIEYLHARGYDVCSDIARPLIAEQRERGGNAVPDEDDDAFAGLMIRRSIRSWQEGMECHPRTVFCDGALPDILAHRRIAKLPDDPALMRTIKMYRYRRTVFVLPPWAEIYHTDEIRTQNFAKSVKNYVRLCQAYIESGHELIEIRKGPVEQRAAQILSRLKL
jgi:predicted ATPase